LPPKQEERVHVIACGVLAADLDRAARRCGVSVTVDYLPGGLHERPGELRRRLQESIDAASSAMETPHRIAIGYGLCGRGTVGIHARSVPLTIPKVQDCIALFLGSDAEYRRQFRECPGTYYISAGWYNERIQPRPASQDADADRNKPPEADHSQLVERYGRENADAIVRFLGSWKRNYKRAAFIDTGAPGRERYAEHAKAMAEEFGWKYEELPGSLDLLEKALTSRKSNREILVVPPGYVTAYDPLSGTIKAAPAWEDGARRAATEPEAPHAPAPEPARDRGIHIGLGIDAGGTYTDVVAYDFHSDSVLAKAKALTTKWDFTVGILEALDQLEPDLLAQAQLVAVSTTLATNAVVEGEGQEVGLLLMPPYGIFDDADVSHAPRSVIAGQMEIDGQERIPVDEAQVRKVGRDLADRGVGAFAVSGFASTINPAHELLVKRILQEETHLSVTCGHELSELLNFRARATTAVLNARIIPRLERFLSQAEAALRRRGVSAPIMVVKGDGSLIQADAARSRPVETIMSGPAASVAGARYLTGRQDATVVDIGGTTTDTGSVKNGAVRISESGTHIGGWDTHVRALRMRTVGLGGDSLIACVEQAVRIGPRRVAPVAWLSSTRAGAGKALDYIEAHLDDFAASTEGADVLALTGRDEEFEATDAEKRILDALSDRPHSLVELASRVGQTHWTLLRTARLEARSLIQRSGLTPTDLLHASGRFQRWDSEASDRLSGMFATIQGLPKAAFIAFVLEEVVRKLATELIKKQFDEKTNPDAMDECPTCRAILDNALSGGDDDFNIQVALKHPVIGIGAPAEFFLPLAGRLIDAEVIIPHDADVANAIGAITSSVTVSRSANVRPDAEGRFVAEGLAGAPTFDTLGEAHEYALGELKRLVREAARSAGTRETDVQVQVDDRTPAAADGTKVFLERHITARLTGRPDAAIR
jgi:N-methylhydantoinase A/oxoprolinase/acetone carboxylase beta subunit